MFLSAGPNAVKGKDIWVKLRFSVQCTAVSRSHTTGKGTIESTIFYPDASMST